MSLCFRIKSVPKVRHRLAFQDQHEPKDQSNDGRYGDDGPENCRMNLFNGQAHNRQGN